MSAAIPIVSILLALLVVGCIGYLAWEVTKEAMIENDKVKHDESDARGTDTTTTKTKH